MLFKNPYEKKKKKNPLVNVLHTLHDLSAQGRAGTCWPTQSILFHRNDTIIIKGSDLIFSAFCGFTVH